MITSYFDLPRFSPPPSAPYSPSSSGSASPQIYSTASDSSIGQAESDLSSSFLSIKQTTLKTAVGRRNFPHHITRFNQTHGDIYAPDEIVAPKGWGASLVVEGGTLMITSTKMWEEAFHPELGLLRTERGGKLRSTGAMEVQVGEESFTEDIGDQVEWLVLDLRFAAGCDEYRSTEDVIATQIGVISEIANMCQEVGNNPSYLPRVHKLTFLGSEYAENMTASRAKEVAKVVGGLKGLLAVEWLPSHDNPHRPFQPFSPAPSTPSYTSMAQPASGSSYRSSTGSAPGTVTFPTCLVPPDLVRVGEHWGYNSNSRPEGEIVDPYEQETPIDVVSERKASTLVDSAAQYQEDRIQDRSTSQSEQISEGRAAGYRFYSDASEADTMGARKQADIDALAISPLGWLGGLRCLKIQGGFPMVQPDESAGFAKPDYSFAFKRWIGDAGVETLVWSFRGSYTEPSTLTILKHVFSFITSWPKHSLPLKTKDRQTCSLFVLQYLHPHIIAKLRDSSDEPTRRRAGIRIDNDLPSETFEWLRDVVFIEDKEFIEDEGREVSRLTRLWDTSDEAENIELDMDQTRAITRLKAEVLAHARAGRGAMPRPVRSQRSKPRKPLDWAALRNRKGDLKLDLSDRSKTTQHEQEQEPETPLKSSSTIRPLFGFARQATTRMNSVDNLNRVDSFSTDPSSMVRSNSSISEISVETTEGENVSISPQIATAGEDIASSRFWGITVTEDGCAVDEQRTGLDNEIVSCTNA